MFSFDCKKFSFSLFIYRLIKSEFHSRRVRIVILDEATANLDSVTDHLVQKCLHEAFSECTVLLIAHRLENVLGMEKILFMEQGKVI